jgi:hypothetical protein
MKSPSSSFLPLRLRLASGRLLCSLRLPWIGADRGAGLRELVLVASATRPYLRHLTVYRLAAPIEAPDYPPRAA